MLGFVRALAVKTLLVLDDLPQITSGDELSERLGRWLQPVVNLAFVSFRRAHMNFPELASVPRRQGSTWNACPPVY